MPKQTPLQNKKVAIAKNMTPAKINMGNPLFKAVTQDLSNPFPKKSNGFDTKKYA